MTYSVFAPAASTVDTRLALVPDPSVADHYVSRSIAGVRDFDLYDQARAERKNVLLYGPTGPGKTTSAIAYAASRGLPYYLIPGNIALDTSQLFGKYVPDGDGGVCWQDGGFTECVRHGGVVILDEINFFLSKIITAVFPVLADTRHLPLMDHKGETVHAHPDLLIVATMNPRYHGTQALNQALRNRFTYQVRWGYDDAVERALVPVKALREFANQLRGREALDEITTPTPTNALMDFLQIANSLGLSFAVSNFVSRYEDEEQAIVRLALDTHLANIEAELDLTDTPVVEHDESPVSLTGLDLTL